MSEKHINPATTQVTIDIPSATLPAKVCTQCGGIWLSASVAKEMDEALTERRGIVRVEQVPVISLEKIGAP